MKKTIKTEAGNYQIEIEDKIHDLGIKFEDVKIPKGWRLLSLHEAETIARDKRIIKKLNLYKYEYYIKQFNKAFVMVCWLGSFSSCFFANDGDVYYDYCLRGVLFCRTIKK